MSEEHSYPFIQLKYVLDQVIYQALGRPYFTFKTNLDLEEDMYFAYHQPITNHLANYYQKWSSQMLFNARMIEVYFNLNDRDIEEFNHDFRDVEKNFGQLIPIYLKQFGAYFYLNKISNYISGKLTKCELIKL